MANVRDDGRFIGHMAMQVIKNINNNVSVCLDSAGNSVVCFGKGIGFKHPPYELSLAEIDKTYYDVDSVYLSMINDLPEDVLHAADTIVTYARKVVHNQLNPNIVFTLADHINFSIERFKKQMDITLPIMTDIENLFETEMKVGRYGLRIIREQLHVRLPKNEAASIALHIINAQEQAADSPRSDNERIVAEATELIERYFGIQINREDFNYSRFVSHVHYLIKRSKGHEALHSDNSGMFDAMVAEYPEVSACADQVSAFLEQQLGVMLSEEERLYLMLHINRLCTREGCHLSAAGLDLSEEGKEAPTRTHH